MCATNQFRVHPECTEVSRTEFQKEHNRQKDCIFLKGRILRHLSALGVATVYLTL